MKRQVEDHNATTRNTAQRCADGIALNTPQSLGSDSMPKQANGNRVGNLVTSVHQYDELTVVSTNTITASMEMLSAASSARKPPPTTDTPGAAGESAWTATSSAAAVADAIKTLPADIRR